MTVAPESGNPRLLLGRLSVAWLVAIALAVSVVLFAPRDLRFEWLVAAIGVCTLVSFALQLGTARTEGFLARLAFSVVGSVILIFVIEFIALIVATARM